MTKYKLNLEEIKESDIPVDHRDVMRWLTEMTLLIPIEEKFPAPGKKYYYISSSGKVKSTLWNNHKSDQWRDYMDNIFPTAEAAQESKDSHL